MAHLFGEPVPYDAEQSQRIKKRRYLSRSDEEIQDEMDKGGLSYRAGWPNLPPLPVDTIFTDAFKLVPDASKRIQDAVDILETQGVSNGVRGFAFRVPRDAPDDDDLSPYLTLLCPIDMRKSSNIVVHAITRIRSEFKKHEAAQVIQIEFIDYRALDSLRNFPIHHNDSDIAKKWEGVVLPVILELLKEHEWLSLEMLRRGLDDTPKECPPTVVITTPTARDSKWATTIKPAITKAIKKIDRDFEVEILCGVSLLAGKRKYEPSDLVDGRAYEKVVRMGSSIGISGDPDGCSTLGGAVTLEGGIKCGITNWHCVRDDRLDQGMTSSSLIDIQTNFNAVVSRTKDKTLSCGNKTLSNVPQRILSPSTFDHHSRQAQLNAAIKIFATSVAPGHAVYEDLKKKDEWRLNEEAQADRYLGQVYAGSGRRTIAAPKYATDFKTGKSKGKQCQEPQYNWISDWALIHIDNIKQRDVVNQLPETVTGKVLPLVHDMICNQWSTFNVNRERITVAKFGRSTHQTRAVINSTIVLIDPSVDAQISKVYGFTDKYRGACYEVVKAKVKDPEFLDLGDSGSILLHSESGTQLGLLFGMGSTGNAYFIPMGLVIQDIENVTGKKVVEPAFVSKWYSI
ncbi:hypothetical protein COCVIDRAFT_97721 [Bipolaris victoriae FI3]|uniref:Uncharacterized protein n=1 Tax=Bipolaris victoriae (strain FI3) TaxID=930091 RepID=W7EKQ5_BIPV3|nr:hypothetical protein COCVIDRAFT_97721 [Bipolaris victoriae FI3]